MIIKTSEDIQNALKDLLDGKQNYTIIQAIILLKELKSQIQEMEVNQKENESSKY